MDSKVYDELLTARIYGLDTPAIESIYSPLYFTIMDHLNKVERIIEIGCGTGQLAQLLIVNQYQYVKGIDFSITAIELSRIRSGEEFRDRFILEDLYDFDFIRNDYDTVIACEVLEHLEDDIGLLERIPQGIKVILSVPNFGSPTHIRYYTNLDEAVKRYGKVLNITHSGHIILSKTATIYLIIGERK